jgi:tRNA pseudouridine55 synthase
MDGVLLIDKPSGPTSHDVVARIRRTSGEPRVGHTGTLDPLASGLLPLVLGRATRLASLLSVGDKTYEATIHLGVATDTDDAEGRQIGPVTSTLPDDAAIERTLQEFRGTFAQRPPSHSAKKIGGHKAYDLARRREPVELKPVEVTVRELECTGREDSRLSIHVSVTSGFYVRALARDLGQRLGCGAHLTALRRTKSGTFQLAGALPLDEAARLGGEVAQRLVAPADALADLPAVYVAAPGLKRAVHGNALGPEHLAGGGWPAHSVTGRVRVIGPDGRLVALADSRGGALHPVVVLG